MQTVETMSEARFKARTRVLAIAVMKRAESWPKGRSADHISRQVIRCASSVFVNYRSACRAKSRADMIAKLAIVEEEADETLAWLDLASELAIVDRSEIEEVYREAEEILSMIVASLRTLKDPAKSTKSVAENLAHYGISLDAGTNWPTGRESKIQNPKSRIGAKR